MIRDRELIQSLTNHIYGSMLIESQLWMSMNVAAKCLISRDFHTNLFNDFL
ncbi:hypothetical protein PUN4_550017 [Paraburkholderia unamae]|nr:hypothetical protein PUN4_550017 [Paraburkholderia unamae]